MGSTGVTGFAEVRWLILWGIGLFLGGDCATGAGYKRDRKINSRDVEDGSFLATDGHGWTRIKRRANR